MRGAAVAGVMIAAMAMTLPVNGRVTPAKGLATSRCPGWIHADQYDVGGARTVWTVALEDKDKKDKWWPASGSMGVHMVFKSAAPTRSLEFIVSYLPAGVHGMRANPDANSAQEMTKSYSLVTSDKLRVDADLLVGPASTVTRVRLIGATFADESVWHAGAEDTCGVAPKRVLSMDGKESSLKW